MSRGRHRGQGREQFINRPLCGFPSSPTHGFPGSTCTSEAYITYITCVSSYMSNGKQEKEGRKVGNLMRPI